MDDNIKMRTLDEIRALRNKADAQESVEQTDEGFFKSLKNSFSDGMRSEVKKSIDPKHLDKYNIDSAKSVGDIKNIMKKAKSAGHMKEDVEQADESTKAYGNSMRKLANDRKKALITKSDTRKLSKLSDLMDREKRLKARKEEVEQVEEGRKLNLTINPKWTAKEINREIKDTKQEIKWGQEGHKKRPMNPTQSDNHWERKHYLTKLLALKKKGVKESVEQVDEAKNPHPMGSTRVVNKKGHELHGKKVKVNRTATGLAKKGIHGVSLADGSSLVSHRMQSSELQKESVEQVDEAMVNQDRYLRSHGKKAKGQGRWSFTTMRTGTPNEKDVLTATGKLGDVANIAQRNFKGKDIYVMESSEQITEAIDLKRAKPIDIIRDISSKTKDKITQVGVAKGKNGKGVMMTDDSYGHQMVYQIGTKFLVAVKVVMTAGWSYFLFDSAASVAKGPDAAIGKGGPGTGVKNLDKIAKGLKVTMESVEQTDEMSNKLLNRYSDAAKKDTKKDRAKGMRKARNIRTQRANKGLFGSDIGEDFEQTDEGIFSTGIAKVKAGHYNRKANKSFNKARSALGYSKGKSIAKGTSDEEGFAKHMKKSNDYERKAKKIKSDAFRKTKKFASYKGNLRDDPPRPPYKSKLRDDPPHIQKWSKESVEQTDEGRILDKLRFKNKKAPNRGPSDYIKAGETHDIGGTKVKFTKAGNQGHIGYSWKKSNGKEGYEEYHPKRFKNHDEVKANIASEIKSQSKQRKGSIERPRGRESVEQVDEARPASNAKNYVRKGGNKEQFKWKVTLNNRKTKTVSSDSRRNVKHSLSPEQLIIGIKSAKKIEESVEHVDEATSNYLSKDQLPAKVQRVATNIFKLAKKEKKKIARLSVELVGKKYYVYVELGRDNNDEDFVGKMMDMETGREKFVEINPSASVHPAPSVSIKESVDQVDELSGDALHRYLAKSMNKSDTAKRLGNTATRNKREKGIKQALKKQTGKAKVNATESQD